MKRMHIFSILTMIVVYVLASLVVDQSFILPKLNEVWNSFILIITANDFLIIIFSTIARFLIGVLISFIISFILSSLAYNNHEFREFMEPIYIFLKTIPNITYIIVSLIWLGRDGSVILVSLLSIFPLMYNSFLSAYLNIDKELIDFTRLYNFSYSYKFFKVYLPLIRKDMIIAINNSLSLAFRVSVMAEILGQVRVGIGKAMYYAKINYLMSDIFAWTIIIIIISALIDFIFSRLSKLLD